MKKTSGTRRVIGRSTELMFVGFSDARVPAKVDTGAYRSALHATDIYVDDDKILHFRVLGSHPVCQGVAFDATTSSYKVVSIANSFGDSEERYEVSLRIKIGKRTFTTTFTLADRGKKIYPILLGRKALKRRYIVDIEKSGINRDALRERFQIELPEDEEMIYND